MNPNSINKNGLNDSDLVKVRSSYRDAKSTFMSSSPFKQGMMKAEER